MYKDVKEKIKQKKENQLFKKSHQRRTDERTDNRKNRETCSSTLRYPSLSWNGPHKEPMIDTKTIQMGNLLELFSLWILGKAEICNSITAIWEDVELVYLIKDTKCNHICLET